MLTHYKKIKFMSKGTYSVEEIRAAWEQYQEDEITEKQLEPYYRSMLEQHMWDLFSEFVAESNMPYGVQKWFVSHDDADEIMLRYSIYSGFDGEEIDEGNGAAFLKNPYIKVQTIEKMIERFYLSEKDQRGFFNITSPQVKPHIGDLLKKYKETWGSDSIFGLSSKVEAKAKKKGYL